MYARLSNITHIQTQLSMNVNKFSECVQSWFILAKSGDTFIIVMFIDAAKLISHFPFHLNFIDCVLILLDGNSSLSTLAFILSYFDVILCRSRISISLILSPIHHRKFPNLQISPQLVHVR